MPRSAPGPRLAGIRLLAFGSVYILHQIIGLLALALLMASGQRRNHGAHRRVQGQWTDSLLRWARRLLGIEIVWPEVELPDDRFIILSRHCSPVDATLPAHWITYSHKRPIHYVLKNQLRFDPCISLFGRRLGNAFIDRADGAEAVSTIRHVAANAEPRSAMVVFPEGTYASPQHRRRVLARLAERGDEEAIAVARSLEHLLPPRPAGTLAVLEELPDADVVAIAPVGLDGLAGLHPQVRRVPLEDPIRVRVRVYHRDCIPEGEDDRKTWLNEVWRSMDAVVTSTEAGITSPEEPWA